MNSRKIIATLGPSSLNKNIVKKMDYNGVDIFRLNLSHTKIDELENQILELKSWTKKNNMFRYRRKATKNWKSDKR